MGLPIEFKIIMMLNALFKNAIIIPNPTFMLWMNMTIPRIANRTGG